MWVAFEGNLEVVRYLTGERGASVDGVDSDGVAVFMVAARNGHLEVSSW